ncbi:hypothetical protein RTBOTA2_006864 [Rhodotorula toruloides]|nr:hypothetical protein RTBOTA2_006864 [Rhodotorula toruloides]
MAPRNKGKGRASTSNQNMTSSLKPSLILQRGKRSFLIALPNSFAHAMAETRRLFPKLAPDTLVLEREVAGFGWVRLTVSGWESESAALSTQGGDGPAVVRVEVDSWSDDGDVVQPDRKRKRCSSESPEPFKLPRAVSKARVSPNAQYCLHIKPTTPMSKIFETMATKVGMARDEFTLTYEGDKVSSFGTFAALQDFYDMDLTDPDVLLNWHLVARGGKPVIYLFPPTPLDSAAVSVALTPEWHFCALYPVVDPVKQGEGETSATWTVSAQPDGSLVDLASGLELKYLFWEAEAYRTTSTPSYLAFDPSKTLAALSLHTTARNNFITYWLSHFTRIRDAGQHIGFRFLAQADYERAARLDFDPKPDVVTRVFLLFKGVDAVEASEWRKPDKVDWLKEVGVEVDKVKDESLFRVLEWGGMEVV